MPEELQIPDLTRVSRKKGTAPEGLFKFHDTFYRILDLNPDYLAFYRLSSEIGGPWGIECMINSSLEKIFLPYFSMDDAIYRSDFLEELLEKPDVKKAVSDVYEKLPQFSIDAIPKDPALLAHQQDDIIAKQADSITSFTKLPTTLESMADLPGTSQAVKDIRSFAEEAIDIIEQYLSFLKELKKIQLFRNHPNWANQESMLTCINVMKKVPILDEIRGIRDQIEYFMLAALFYETPVKGEKLHSCKPRFLDPELRQGTIKNAYHPGYFKYQILHKEPINLCVANDIYWGNDARHNFIRGPNSRGKSVFIRTIGLDIHLVMAGLRPFADSCELSLPGQIFTCFDTGDSSGKGHFETGGSPVDYMLSNLQRRDIVLLDEVGAGTEPEYERKIAKGITDGLSAHDITFFNVTHDKGTWGNYIGRKGTRMLRVSDLDDEKRKYKVWEGTTEGGYAMKMAERMGIDPPSVKRRLKERFN